ncbi:MAG: hypothetical protein ABIS69_02170 [Sediminibacterium sp.]
MKDRKMGLIYADIEIINSEELGMARRGFIDIDEIKRIHINMLVDTGSYMLAINENIQAYLQLPFITTRSARLANENSIECDVVGPVLLRFKNRTATCNAIVLPGNAEPLLGAIPLEEMDVVINPIRQELTVNPDSPDMASTKLKQLATA